MFGSPNSSGLVLRPTRKKRGEYERLGLVDIHTKSDELLTISKSPGLLNEADYLAFDTDKGFTITIV